jgi:hypothetical protein
MPNPEATVASVPNTINLLTGRHPGVHPGQRGVHAGEQGGLDPYDDRVLADQLASAVRPGQQAAQASYRTVI